MQRKELSCADVQWILEKLPTDIITTIILSYNPESLYILSDDLILKHDWRKQCQLTFNTHPDSETRDWLMIYYNLSQRSKQKRNIACGNFHTVIQRADGTLMSTGSNSLGQSGLGDMTIRNVFTNIPDVRKDIVAIACGYDHTIKSEWYDNE